MFTRFSCAFLGWVLGMYVMGLIGFPPQPVSFIIGLIYAAVYAKITYKPTKSE